MYLNVPGHGSALETFSKEIEHCVLLMQLGCRRLINVPLAGVKLQLDFE
jgi:hypothetical protein